MIFDCETPKVMNNFGVRWLTRVFQVDWKTGEVPKQWQTNALMPIHKKSDKRQFLLVNFVYRTISYLFIWKARQFLLKNSSQA